MKIFFNILYFVVLLFIVIRIHDVAIIYAGDSMGECGDRQCNGRECFADIDCNSLKCKFGECAPVPVQSDNGNAGCLPCCSVGTCGSYDCATACNWNKPATPSQVLCNPNDWSSWSPECTPQNCDSAVQTRTNACNQSDSRRCSCVITYTPTPPTLTVTPPLSGTPTPFEWATPTTTPNPEVTSTGTPVTGGFISWFKTKLGNVHSNRDIIVSLPSLREKFASFLVTVNNLSSFAAGSMYDARPDLASEKNWYWYSPPYGQINYPELKGFFDYYRSFKNPQKTVTMNQLNNSSITSLLSGGNDISIVAINSDAGLITGEDINLSGNKLLVLYINGDLYIKNNIIIKNDAGIIFVVKGNLNISGDPTEVDGVFMVDKTINTSNRDSSTPLTIRGALYSSNQGKIFGQSRKSQDVMVASELVIFEPKYLIKFSPAIGRSVYMWHEVAP